LNIQWIYICFWTLTFVWIFRHTMIW